jgi:hypothetical protein
LERLDVRERARCARIVQRTRQYGVTDADILDQARRMFALPLAEQLAEIDRQAAILRAEGLTAADLRHISYTLTRYYRPSESYP